MTTSTGDKKRWLALLVVLLAMFMDMVDVTIISVALPRVQENLDASYSAGQWMLAGYSLAYALLLVTGGRLGDIVGRRKIFMIGVAGFTVASALAGAATSPLMLIGARVVQGAFAGVMVPQVMSVITTQFTSVKERAAAFGMFGGVIGLAQVSGPLLGGVLTQYSLFGLGWRAIFLINVPVGVFALFGAVRWMRESRSEHPMRLDILGVVLVGAASLLLMYPLLQGRELGWPAWTFAALAASVPTLIAFVRYERRRDAARSAALVPMHLFRRRSYAAGVAVMFVMFSGVMSFFLILTWLLQFGLGWSPLHLALTSLAWPVGIAVTSQIALKHGQDHGRALIGIGGVVLALGTAALLWVVHHFGADVTTWHILPCMFVAGLGMGLGVSIISNVVLGDVPHEDAGAASGVLNSVIQIGGAVGVALVGVIFFGLLGGGAADRAAAVTPRIRAELTAAGVPAAAQDQIVTGFRTCFVDRAKAKDPATEPASCRRAAASAAGPAGQRTGAIVRTAAIDAGKANFSDTAAKTLGYNVVVFLLAALLTPLLPRRAAAMEPAEEEDKTPAMA